MRFTLRLMGPAFLTGIIFLSASCSLERLFPDQVADGIARLSVHNFGNLVLALHHVSPTDSRQECDFRSRVLSDKSSIVEHDAHGKGAVTWAFENCELDFGREGKTIDTSTSCGPEQITFFGKVKISGTRTITGLLTGSNKDPVMPSGTEGVDFKFTRVTFENYRVESTTLDKAMTIATGTVAFDAKVHMAKSRETNLCEIPLPNLTLSNIKYGPSPHPAETIVKLPGPLGEFQATIDSSDFAAQVGVHNDAKNHLEGKITVWGQNFKIPTDTAALNPSFSMQAYDTSLSCIADLELPISTPHQCIGETKPAAGVARLSVLNFMSLMAALSEKESTDKREQCRITASDRHPADSISHIGESLGEAVWNFSDCEFDFGQAGTSIKLNPSDKDKTKLFGKVRLSGQRRMAGYLTGDSGTPIIPGHGDVTFTFTKVVFDNYKVKAPDLEESMMMESGSAAFDVDIHLGKNNAGLCIVRLPNPTVRNIKYLEPSVVSISLPMGDLKTTVSDSNFHAQIGKHLEVANHIGGDITIFGTKVDLAGNDTKLSPDFNEGAYDQELLDHAELKKGDHECGSFEPLEVDLAGAIARLLVLNIGVITQEAALEDLKVTRPDTKCGFDIDEIQRKAISYEGAAGKQGHIVLGVENCLVINQKEVLGEDTDHCSHTTSGKTTIVQGTVRLSGTQKIKGMREDPWWLNSDGRWIRGIVPNRANGISFDFTKIEPHHYSAYQVYTDQPLPLANLTLESGTLSARVYPVLAEVAGKPCEFKRSTPIVRMVIKADKDIPASLDLHVKDFGLNMSKKLTINSIDLEAFNGKYQGTGNYMRGTLVIDGKSYSFDEAFDLNFTQEKFDAEYSCKLKTDHPRPIRALIKPDLGWHPEGCPVFE